MTFTQFEVGRIREQYAWLIKLRWFAVLGVVAVFFIVFFFSLQFPYLLLLFFLACLIIHNLTSAWLPKLFKPEEPIKTYFYLKKITLYQIITDLVLLTLFLHLSSGIENPFIMFYLFHAVLTSILFSYRTSIIIGIFIIALLTILVMGEYFGIIPHYPISLQLNYYNNLLVIITMLGVFTFANFILIYLSSTITMKLRDQERAFYMINDELTIANAELAEKDHIKNEYVSRVTHDIKGHLASIQTLLAVLVLQDPNKTESIKPDFIKKAYNRVLLLNEFVKDLLKLTHLRLLYRNKIEKIKIHTIIDKIQLTLAPLAQAKEINLIFNSKIQKEIEGEYTSLEEALQNIVSNAIKYTPVKGEVVVTLSSRVAGYICIEVADTGYGIPEEELDKIFEEFYRASNTHNLVEGTGLGLSLVKQIIERHNGKISVVSTIGEGTKFMVLLPLINAE